MLSSISKASFGGGVAVGCARYQKYSLERFIGGCKPAPKSCARACASALYSQSLLWMCLEMAWEEQEPFWGSG